MTRSNHARLLAVLLLAVALARRRTFWRIAGLVLLGLLAVAEWSFLLVLSRLPDQDA